MTTAAAGGASTTGGARTLSGARVKGTIVIQVVKYLRSRGAEGRAAVPAELSQYLTNRILAAAWYPEEEYIELMKAVARIMPAPADPTISKFELSARETAAAYFEGPYKVLVRPGNPGGTLKNLTALWRLRHDTGEMRVEVDGDTARVVIAGYPVVAAEMCDLIKGSIWGILSYAGASDIAVEHVSCRARGARDCEWRASWR